ncbi:hypothetical protein D7X88_19005, partial [bacterium C-53]
MRGFSRGFGILPNKQNLSGKPWRGRADLRKRVPFSYACSETYHLENTERKGKEWIGNWKSRTAAICRKKGSRQKKPSATKSAAHTMKCLPPAAARNG